MTRKATKAEIARAEASYQATHWGFQATSITDVHDPDLPDVLVEMGRLVMLVVDPEIPGEPDALVEIAFDARCILAYDAGPSTRIYCLLPGDIQSDMRRDLWDAGGPELVTQLSAVAKLAGGQQNRWPYPRVAVKVVGRLHEVFYEASKKGEDGVERQGQTQVYCHELGEESGVKPYLCVDRKGRIWVAGSNHKTLPAGITD